jgi:hypothetical protein
MADAPTRLGKRVMPEALCLPFDPLRARKALLMARHLWAPPSAAAPARAFAPMVGQAIPAALRVNAS